LVLISLARSSAAMRCVRERLGVLTGGLAAACGDDLVAAGMGGDYTHAGGACKVDSRKLFANLNALPRARRRRFLPIVLAIACRHFAGDPKWPARGYLTKAAQIAP
jgi:hypothetical protein